ncbi:hypothetical protein D3C73_599320 [compost metagenome]
MPQLTVRGIRTQIMKEVSLKLIEELAFICECGTDNFTVDGLQINSVFGGQEVETFAFVEVAWFERGREVRDRVAEAITRHIQLAGIEDVEVAFKVYREDSYYVNGLACNQ